MATIANLAVNLTAKTAVFESKMRKARGSVSGFGNAAGMVGKILAAGFVAQGVRVAIRSAVDFEYQMAMVNTMLDKTSGKHLPMLSKSIRAFSREFGEGTATLSKGMYDILSASIDATKATEVLRISVIAAKAGFTTTAVSADAITTIINSYGLAAEDAASVSDLLFAIVKRGKTTFDELAPNIGKVAAIASIAGVSLEDLGAAIATLTRAGLPTEIALTSLRSIINAFLKPTDSAREAAAAYGIKLDTATLRAIRLTGVLQQLNGVSAETLAEIIPNVRGLAGLAAALKNAEGNAYDYQLMLDRAGKSQEAFEKVAATSRYQLDQFGQSAKEAGRAIGESLIMPILRGANKTGNKLKGIFGPILEWTRSLGDKLPTYDIPGKIDAITESTKKLATATKAAFIPPGPTPVPDFLKDLMKQFSEKGKDKYDITADKMKTLGVGNSSMLKMVRWMQSEEKMQELQKTGASLFESTRTPLERYETSLTSFSKLLESGAIDWDTYGRAVRMAHEDLAKFEDINKPGAISAEAQEVRSRFIDVGGLSLGTNLESLNNQQLTEAKKHTQLLTNIAGTETLQ